MLLEKAEPDLKDGLGITPLAWARQLKYKAIEQLLLATKRINPDPKLPRELLGNN